MLFEKVKHNWGYCYTVIGLERMKVVRCVKDAAFDGREQKREVPTGPTERD